MDIRQLKDRLDILQVAAHLDIQVDKGSKKAHCPFHDDKTPSLQFSKEKQIATCFSSNCNAGTMDVISLTEKKLRLTRPDLSTHEALKYLSNLTGLSVRNEMKAEEVQPSKPTQVQPNDQKDFEQDFIQMQSSFIASSTARNYLESRSIDWKKLNAPGGARLSVAVTRDKLLWMEPHAFQTRARSFLPWACTSHRNEDSMRE